MLARKLLVLLSLLCYCALANANANIEISGNKRIETNTILSYFPDKENLTQKDLDRSLKKLYQTKLFSNIEIFLSDRIVKVIIKENPVINKIEINGNKKLSDTVLLQEMSLEERGVYTKAKLIQDVARINEIYKRSGRINAKIIPKVKFLENNRLDIIINVDEDKKIKIHQVIFHNNHKFSDKKLRKIIATKERKWYRGSSSFFDPDKIIFDKQLLRKFYFNNGYATFNTNDVKIEYIPEIKGFIANYFITEGAIYRFAEVSFTSQYDNIDIASLKPLVKIKSGAKFSLEAIEKSIDAVLLKLNDMGFAFADVEYDLQADKNQQTVALQIMIKKNKKVYIRNIDIIGNDRTEDKVIRREIRFLEGDPYNNSLLKRSQQRLSNLGFFDNVKIHKYPVPGKDLIDIKFEVLEKPTGELNFGFGYSSTEKFLGNVSIKESNLMGKAHNASVSLQKSSRSNDLDFSYMIPNFLGREFAFGIDLFNLKSEYSESFSEITTQGFRLKAFYELQEYLSQSVDYSFKIDEVTNVDPDASRFIKDQEGRNSYSAVSQSIFYDRRDSSINPSEGYYLKLSNTLAGIGGNIRFFRTELGGVRYFPLLKEKLILKTLLKGGMIEGYGGKDININYRFFLGGSSLRGFRNAGIGPRDNKNAALGGKYFYKGTVELLFPLGLPEELGFKGSVFSDFGNLTGLDNKDVDILTKDIIRVSGGVGISWDSPLGPIRFDFASALQKASFDETENFRINFGTRF